MLNKIKFIVLFVLIGANLSTSFSVNEEVFGKKDILYSFSDQKKQNCLFTFLHHWMSMREMTQLLLSPAFKYLDKYCLKKEVPLNNDDVVAVIFEGRCDPKKMYEECPFYDLSEKLFQLLEDLMKEEKMRLFEKDENKVQMLDVLMNDFYSNIQEGFFEEDELESLLEDLYREINVSDNQLHSYFDSLSIWAASQKDFSNYIQELDAKESYLLKDRLPMTLFETYLSFYKEFVSANFHTLNKIVEFLNTFVEIGEKTSDGFITREDILHMKRVRQKVSVQSLSELAFYSKNVKE